MTNPTTRVPFTKNYWLWFFILVFLVIWVNTFLYTNDMNNWIIENMLTFLGLVFLIGTYKKYQFSIPGYFFLSLFFCLHIYGSKYTYAENPFGYWLQEVVGGSRNHYDRIVHFSFGFLLAYPLREMWVNWLKYPSRGAWLVPVIWSLTFSAIYEIIEWAVADIFFKAQGHAYLGTQGDIWDAQKDTFLAFFGALLATLFISLIRKLKTDNAKIKK